MLKARITPPRPSGPEIEHFNPIHTTHTPTPQHADVMYREFRLATDIYAQDSIELLKHSGIDFPRNESQGIDVQRFAELLMSSGVVLNDEVGASALLANTSCSGA